MDKWVRIMADYCATAFWTKTGGNAGWDFVPVSPDLLAELAVWVFEYNQIDPEGAEPCRQIRPTWAAHGLSLAKRVKSELPDWTVVYFDEAELAKCLDREQAAPRDTYEYEVVLASAHPSPEPDNGNSPSATPSGPRAPEV